MFITENRSYYIVAIHEDICNKGQDVKRIIKFDDELEAMQYTKDFNDYVNSTNTNEYRIYAEYLGT